MSLLLKLRLQGPSNTRVPNFVISILDLFFLLQEDLSQLYKL